MIVPVLNRFLHWSVVGLISPVLVLMIMSKGVGVESVGFVMALMSTALVLLELPSGILSDLIGRARVYLVSLIIAAAALATLFFARGMLGLCIGFALYGISRAFSSGSIESAYIDAFISRKGKDKLHSFLTALGIGETAGLALGSLAGGFIPSLWRRMAPSQNPYGGNVLAQIGLIAILFALTLATRRPESIDPHMKLGRFLAESGSFLRESRLLRLLLAGVALWGISFNAIELFWQPRLRESIGEGSSASPYGLLNAGYFLAAALGSLLINAILSRAKATRRKPSSLALIGCLRVAVGASIIALSRQGGVPGFAFFFLTTMFLNGMMGIPENTVFAAAVPSEKRASFLSLASLTMQVGGIVASLAFGAVKRIAPVGTIWLIAGTLFAGSSLLYFRAHRIRS